jgi:hypothetical protein
VLGAVDPAVHAAGEQRQLMAARERRGCHVPAEEDGPAEDQDATRSCPSESRWTGA